MAVAREWRPNGWAKKGKQRGGGGGGRGYRKRKEHVGSLALLDLTEAATNGCMELQKDEWSDHDSSTLCKAS